jgi:hypothetical protein
MARGTTGRSLAGLLGLSALLGACAAGSDAVEASDRPGPPVVTSVVGPATSAPEGTPAPDLDDAGTTTPSSSPGRGPTSTSSSVRAPAGAVEVARNFLGRYWKGGRRTYAQLARDVTPYAVPELVAAWRAPAMADRPVAGGAVTEVTVEITEVHGETAVAVARGISVESGRRTTVWRTLDLHTDGAGRWKVEGLR